MDCCSERQCPKAGMYRQPSPLSCAQHAAELWDSGTAAAAARQQQYLHGHGSDASHPRCPMPYGYTCLLSEDIHCGLQALPLKLAKGRGAAAACVAVVYKACALEGYPRTFKELLAAVPEANTKKVLPSACLLPWLRRASPMAARTQASVLAHQALKFSCACSCN